MKFTYNNKFNGKELIKVELDNEKLTEKDAIEIYRKLFDTIYKEETCNEKIFYIYKEECYFEIDEIIVSDYNLLCLLINIAMTHYLEIPDDACVEKKRDELELFESDLFEDNKRYYKYFIEEYTVKVHYDSVDKIPYLNIYIENIANDNNNIVLENEYKRRQYDVYIGKILSKIISGLKKPDASVSSEDMDYISRIFLTKSEKIWFEKGVISISKESKYIWKTILNYRKFNINNNRSEFMVRYKYDRRYIDIGISEIENDTEFDKKIQGIIRQIIEADRENLERIFSKPQCKDNVRKYRHNKEGFFIGIDDRCIDISTEFFRDILYYQMSYFNKIEYTLEEHNECAPLMFKLNAFYIPHIRFIDILLDIVKDFDQKINDSIETKEAIHYILKVEDIIMDVELIEKQIKRYSLKNIYDNKSEVTIIMNGNEEENIEESVRTKLEQYLKYMSYLHSRFVFNEEEMKNEFKKRIEKYKYLRLKKPYMIEINKTGNDIDNFLSELEKDIVNPNEIQLKLHFEGYKEPVGLSEILNNRSQGDVNEILEYIATEKEKRQPEKCIVAIEENNHNEDSIFNEYTPDKLEDIIENSKWGQRDEQKNFVKILFDLIIFKKLYRNKTKVKEFTRWQKEGKEKKYFKQTVGFEKYFGRVSDRTIHKEIIIEIFGIERVTAKKLMDAIDEDKLRRLIEAIR